MKIRAAMLALLPALLASGAAEAATSSITVMDVNLRAGPGTGYPVVRVIAAGSRVVTFGCLADYSWCDVGVAGVRGWVASRYITIASGGTTVVVTQATAVRIGVPVVAYGSAYWHAHYVGYPWYARGHAYYARPVAGPAVRRPARCLDGCSASRTTTGPRGRTYSRSFTFDP
ncbi:SH3 domain-containing protein [Rhizobium sp. TRM95111]|uniref:SH3 domain-containing protein n=1 Tax=Rhizobium alarense TaxID=2846851 RepID=UPI001F1ED027|nr:SH3 domain-containing protein [Rhizobium alarense]MCF3641287.1 SH3 domain-containing protein [Rhizobium alarense]